MDMYIYINMCTSLVVDTELVSREVCFCDAV